MTFPAQPSRIRAAKNEAPGITHHPLRADKGCETFRRLITFFSFLIGSILTCPSYLNIPSLILHCLCTWG